MRILVVTNMYPYPERPAYGTFVYDEVQSLRAAGVDVDVLFVNGKLGRQEYLRGFGEVRRRISSGHYDLVHGHYVFSGVIARTQWRCPVVVTFHGIEAAMTWTRWVSRALAPLVDRVIVTSERVRRDLGWPKAVVIPPGIEFDLFQPMPRDEARAALGLPQDRQLVLWAGDPRPDKQVHIVEAAVAQLQDAGVPVELVLLSGQPHERVPLYMNACDVLVLTSQYEGSPMVVKEALACGLPVVAPPVGDVPELIQGLEGCYLCERTPEDVADKLRRSLNFGGRHNGREAIAHVERGRIAQQIVALYRELLADKIHQSPTTKSQ
ncbi:MAG TPA: glycosyltransferase family 4 protein [Anaerolineae bacterium]|nr:glycosyltransferase family 4 protein [Anaerolineae bacterium]